MLALAPTLSIAACTPISKLQLSPARAYVTRCFTEEERTFLDAACSRLIPTDVNGPGAVELGVPEFIDREMEGAFGHAATWYMQGPFASALPEFGYQSPLTPREVYRAGIAAVDGHCRRLFDNKSFAELPATDQDAVLTDLEKGALEFDNVSGKASCRHPAMCTLRILGDEIIKKGFLEWVINNPLWLIWIEMVG